MIQSEQDKRLSTPGDRLKYARAVLRVSRAYLQEKYGLPEVTLKSWENGTTKLTQAGIKRCVEVYRKEGLVVSEDWIAEGIGLDPTTTITVSHYFSTPSDKDLPNDDDEVCMIREANRFKESYPHAVVMIVSSDEMRPFYKPGDYVGGKMRFRGDIDSTINKDCIIYLETGEKFFRRLIKNNNGTYNLVCINPTEMTAEPVLYNVNIKGVAPVIWHRKKDD